MMDISVITLFPDMFNAILQHGVVGSAFDNKIANLHIYNLRDYSFDRSGRVDDRPYGGGAGMVIQAPPLAACLHDVVAKSRYAPHVIHLTPQGRVLDHKKLIQFKMLPSLVLVAGRYEGIDERFIEQYVDEEISIGNYVLSGGELPAMVLIDALVRLLPGVVGSKASIEQDSFVNGLLDYPHYTRPTVFEGESVPDILMSGNHDKIRRWRLEQSLKRTWQRRPDMIEDSNLTDEMVALLSRSYEDTGD